jgi:hypothetical protein
MRVVFARVVKPINHSQYLLFPVFPLLSWCVAHFLSFRHTCWFPVVCVCEFVYSCEASFEQREQSVKSDADLRRSEELGWLTRGERHVGHDPQYRAIRFRL